MQLYVNYNLRIIRGTKTGFDHLEEVDFMFLRFYSVEYDLKDMESLYLAVVLVFMGIHALEKARMSGFHFSPLVIVMLSLSNMSLSINILIFSNKNKYFK